MKVASDTSEISPQLSRRQLIKAGLLAAVTCLSPLPVWAQQELLSSSQRALSLMNVHTGERLGKIVYWEQGSYIVEALNDISYLLRDHRNDEVHSIDPTTLDLMAAVTQKVDARAPFEIISGYRSPESNRILRQHSSGVAKQSYHMQGMAVDLRLPGIPLRVVRKAALNLRMGGVGYYPESDFVHLDSASVRSW